MTEREPLGVVLAGGASARMGEPKAALRVGSGPLIERPLAAFAAAGIEAVVVAKRSSPLPDLGVEVWEEPEEPRHPACGIVAALERGGRPVVALACDMPFVPPALLARLAQAGAPFAVPLPAGGPEPLAARYGPEVLPELRRALAERSSMRSLAELLLGSGGERIEAAELLGFGDPARMFANLNRPEDLGSLGF